MAGRRGAAWLLAAALLVAPATPSLAGSSSSCRLIQDAAGDGNDQLNGTRLGPNEPDLDIVSADIASNARSVTTVVRLSNLGTALEAAGRRNLYRFFFQLGSRHEYVVTLATRSLDGEQFSVIVPTEGSDVPGTDTAVPATGTFDVAHNEVRVTIPLSLASGNHNMPHQTYFHNLVADTYRGIGTEAAGGANASTSIDYASTDRRYLAGSSSCVHIGT
ncbi:MAG: hypothetical protein QOJ79_356 [Actinomycetota bacterium]|nr:hypothetical protein [Actinomycetota bacterium]